MEFDSIIFAYTMLWSLIRYSGADATTFFLHTSVDDIIPRENVDNKFLMSQQSKVPIVVLLRVNC